MGMNEAQLKRLKDAKSEPNLQNRMIKLTVFICENCNDEMKQAICDDMESRLNSWEENVQE